MPTSEADAPTPGVTAIVVSHNSAQHLQALGEALAVGSSTPDRMLVVDNASSDDTVARARAAGFEVHETGSNGGFGAACNVALRLTDTEYVLICNPDVRPSSSALEKLVAALSEVDAAAVAGASLDRPFHARRFSRISGNVWGFLPGRLQRKLKGLAPDVLVDPDAHRAVDYVVGAFMLCRVSALRDVGGFDERFFLYTEEEDLCRRLGQRGWLTLLVPTVAVAHGDRGSSEGVDGSQMAAFYFHSLYLYYRKYHSRPYAEWARCVLAACVTVDRAGRALAGRKQVYEASAARAPFSDIRTLRNDLTRRRDGGAREA
jgi:N-acetylglucosaminyl-diphospho-decaprenol L-rhamnosyltransferase